MAQIICEVFNENVTKLTEKELKERCSHCLEKTPGEKCIWLTVKPEEKEEEDGE